jgi:hypothetical protein
MNVLHSLGKRLSTKLAAGFFVVFGLAACALAGYPDKGDDRPLPEVNFTIDAKGNFIAKDSNGKPIGDKCSADPKAENVCPMFKPGHQVQVEQVTNVSIVKYHGSPRCAVVLFNGVWYILPSAEYCKS